MNRTQRVRKAVERAKGHFDISPDEAFAPSGKLHVREVACALEALLAGTPPPPSEHIPEAYEAMLAALRTQDLIAKTIEDDATIPAMEWDSYAHHPEGAFRSGFWCGELSFLRHDAPFVGKTPVIDRADAEQWIAAQLCASARVGRPRKAGVREAYESLFPDGHKIAGVTWKEAARQLSATIGETVTVDTLRRHLGLKT